MLVSPAAQADGEHPRLTPDSVEQVILPGQSYEVEKTVHTPNLPPVLDVCLVVDLSGSYSDDLPNIKLLAPGIWDAIVAGGVTDLQFGLASFVDFPFSPWGSGSDYGYRLDQQLTGTKAMWLTAVNGMVTLNGGDGPESQYEALYQVATGAGNEVVAAPNDSGDIASGGGCDYREDATKVVMLTTDAPFHNAGDAGPFPYPGASAADTQAALVAADIKVIGLKAPGAGGELDALAAATGGTTVTTAADSSNIATAILQALEEIEVEVTMASNCVADTGGVIDTTFDPASRVVENGADAVFTETISVASDAPGGTYTCEDWALIDGEPMVDAEGDIIYESKTILVPENFVTGGGVVTNGEKGKARANLLTFGGNAGYMADGTLVGHWNFNFHDQGVKIQTTEITALQFFDTGLTPAPPEVDADTALMTAEARVKVGNDPWLEGCTVVAGFQDDGEPQNDQVLSLDLDCGTENFFWENLTGGNIQIHDGTKG
ncbi:MAG: hypothetical protein ACQERF_11445 [Actinomycetota bacterium]